MLVLRKRKHRPKGSVLRFCCQCKSNVLPKFRMVCRLQLYLAKVDVRSRLFSFTNYSFLKELKRVLMSVDVPGATRCSLKCFRAGRATHLAKSGVAIAAVLQQGEWTSRAWLRYVDLTAIEQKVLLTTSIQLSDDEDD